MITTTTGTIEGHAVQQYLGIVSAEAIIGANIFKEILTGFRDMLRGRSGTYEKVINEARTHAMNELIQKAQSIGANAIIGIDIDFETINGAGSSMLMVSATGTAVII